MIAANYFDGRSARLHPVQLMTGDGKVALSGDDIDLAYPLAAVRLGEPFAQAPAVLYFSDGARCEVAGEARAGLADVLGYRPSHAVRWQARWPAALAALVLLVALIGAALKWGVPAAAERLVEALPRSVDKSVGEAALAAMEARKMLEPSRFSEERLAEIRQVMISVTPAPARRPPFLRLLVRHSDEFGANALALPDGTIIITDAMIKAILAKNNAFGAYETAQLAGVLAHEIGHIQQRHSAHLLARSSLMAAFSAALFGDFSAVTAAVPTILLSSRHSREMETAADSYAIAELKKLGLPLAPMGQLLEGLGHDGEDAGIGAADWAESFEQYISSHPNLAERGARLRLSDK